MSRTRTAAPRPKAAVGSPVFDRTRLTQPRTNTIRLLFFFPHDDFNGTLFTISPLPPTPSQRRLFSLTFCTSPFPSFPHLVSPGFSLRSRFPNSLSLSSIKTSTNEKKRSQAAKQRTDDSFDVLSTTTMTTTREKSFDVVESRWSEKLNGNKI